MQRMSIPLVAYFSILIVITISIFVLNFPSALDGYQGGQINDLGILGLLIITLLGLCVILINLLNLVVFFIKRKHLLLSTALLTVSLLALSWGNLLSVIFPYEIVASQRARQLVQAKNFNHLKRLYDEECKGATFSVLPRRNYFLLHNHVINVDNNTYGPLKIGLGFFADYYMSGDKNSFRDFDSLITSMPYGLSPHVVRSIYDLMLETELSDIYIDTTLKATVFAWHQSAGAGTRAILFDSTNSQERVRKVLGKVAPVLTLDVLSAGVYYFRTASYQPF